MKEKVFFISPPKSGSKSYSWALKTLGWNSIHNYIELPVRTELRDWEYFRNSEYNAFFDLGWIHWRELLNEFTDSKFIVSYRDPFDLAFSTFNHNQSLLHAGKKVSPILQNAPKFDYSGIATGARLFYTEIFERIISGELSDRVLVTRPEMGWDHLCRFLEVDVPDVPFPHYHDKTNIYKVITTGCEPPPQAFPNVIIGDKT